MESVLLKSQISDYVGNHLSLFYTNFDSKVESVKNYAVSKIREGKKVFYIREENDSEWLWEALQQDPISESYIVEECFKTKSAQDIYLKEGRYTPETIINILKKEEPKALQEGFSGLALCIEVTNVLIKLYSLDYFHEFLRELREFLNTHKSSVFFVYNIERVVNNTVFQVLTTHPEVVLDSEVFTNPFYLSPEKKPLQNFFEQLAESKKFYDHLARSKEVEFDLRNQIKTKEEQKNSLSEKKKELESKLTEIKSENKELSEKVNLQNERVSIIEEKKLLLQGEISKKSDLIEELRISNERINREKVQLEKDVEEALTKISELEGIILSDSKKIQDYQSDIELLLKENETLKDKIKETDSQLERIPTLENEKNELERNLRIMEEKVQSLESTVENLTQENEKHLLEIEEQSQNSKKDTDLFEEERKRNLEKISGLDEEREKLLSELKDSKEACSNLDNEYQNLKNEVFNLKESNEFLDLEISDQKKALEDSVSDNSLLKNELTSKNEMISNLEEQSRRNFEKITLLEEEVCKEKDFKNTALDEKAEIISKLNQVEEQNNFLISENSEKSEILEKLISEKNSAKKIINDIEKEKIETVGKMQEEINFLYGENDLVKKQKIEIEKLLNENFLKIEELNSKLSSEKSKTFEFTDKVRKLENEAAIKIREAEEKAGNLEVESGRMSLEILHLKEDLNRFKK